MGRFKKCTGCGGLIDMSIFGEDIKICHYCEGEKVSEVEQLKMDIAESIKYIHFLLDRNLIDRILNKRDMDEETTT
jgi:hypothetical protein